MLSLFATLRILRPGPRLRLLLRWSLGAGLVALLLVRFNTGAVLSQIEDVSWAIAVPAIFGLTGMHLVGAFTWRFLSARLSGIRLGWAYSARVYYAAQAVGSVTPSNIGADAYRVCALTKGPHRWEGALGPIVIQRVTSYVGLLLLGIGASFLVPLPTGASVLAAFAVALVLVSLGAVWALTRTLPSVGRLAPRLRLPTLNPNAPGRLLSAASGGLLLAVAFHAGSVVLGYLLLVAVSGTGVPLLPALGALVLARLAILLPISISGLGFQEGALVVLFPLAGIPAETALAVSLLNRMALLATVTLGLVFFFAGKIHGTRKAQEVVPSGASGEGHA